MYEQVMYIRMILLLAVYSSSFFFFFGSLYDHKINLALSLCSWVRTKHFALLPLFMDTQKGSLTHPWPMVNFSSPLYSYVTCWKEVRSSNLGLT